MTQRPRPSMRLRYGLPALAALALGIWGAAVDLPFHFKAGDVISAAQMNQTLDALDQGKQERVDHACAAGSSIRAIAADGGVTCEVDDVGTGGGSGVDALNAMTGAITLQAGANVSIDDSQPGQIVISSSGGSGGTGNPFGETWTGTSQTTPGLRVVNLAPDENGTSAIVGRVGDQSTSLGLNATGVWGEVPSGAGVAGSSPSGYGVYGQSVTNIGVIGTSDSGAGVSGNSGAGNGVVGSTSAGNGVFGLAGGGIGVWGKSAARGVVGTLGATSCAGTYGVGGCAVDFIGVHGASTTNTGVDGASTDGIGVYGRSSNNAAVRGDSTGGTGVLGRSAQAGESGVHGETVGTIAAYGVSGFSSGGIGVYGESVSNAGVFGKSRDNNAAFFTGGSGGSGSCFFNGGAGWSCTSDRNAKQDFRSVDPATLLSDLDAMPISTWAMRGDVHAARHLGPTAQDFRSAFGLGDDDTTINTVDAQGVALAAAQALYRQVEAQQAKIDELEARIAALETSRTSP